MKKILCKECNEEMIEVGVTGEVVQALDEEFNMIGARLEKIFQCPKCKHIKIV